MNDGDMLEAGRVIGLWAHIMDDRQWHRLGECLTEDCVRDGSGFDFEPVAGLESITAVLSAEGHAEAHHATNIVVTPADLVPHHFSARMRMAMCSRPGRGTRTVPSAWSATSSTVMFQVSITSTVQRLPSGSARWRKRGRLNPR